jgi:Outer membrane protein
MSSPDVSAPDVSSAQPPWWQASDDAELAAFINEALAGDPDIACRIARLQEVRQNASSKSVGASVRRLLQRDSQAHLQSEIAKHADGLAGRRIEIARRTTLAYFEVRRLQRRKALQAALFEQYRDNREVAQFRQEAGLVPAIDSALAGTLEFSTKAEFGYADAKLADAVAELARQIHSEPETLARRLGIPDTAEPGASTIILPDVKAALPVDPSLVEARKAAEQAVRDARSAYRQGAGSFSALYVAEVAMLSVEQAIIDAQSRSAASEALEKFAGNQDWARQVPPMINSTDESGEALACE